MRDITTELLAKVRLADLIASIKPISMLNHGALAGLNYFASQAKGRILEIGPYIGGSSIAMATGMRDNVGPIISIEAGGAHLNEFGLSSHDIVADLKANLQKFDVVDRVEVLPGLSRDPFVKRQIADELDGDKIGLVFIDSDGRFLPDLAYLSRFMTDDCLIIIDDYGSELAPGKGELVKASVDSMVTEGHFITAYTSGTWFGKLAGAEARKALTKYTQPFDHDEGFSYLQVLTTTAAPDSLADISTSAIELLEDGRLIGPAHSLHDAVRTTGNGAFSHWSPEYDTEAKTVRSTLYFSASDNSNPNTNGRRYEVRYPGGSVVLNP